MNSSVRDNCPECGYPSYVNGYCFGCGLYRQSDKREWKVERRPDLFDMMNSEGAIEDGFNMINNEEECDE